LKEIQILEVKSIIIAKSARQKTNLTTPGVCVIPAMRSNDEVIRLNIGEIIMERNDRISF
jgi:hypothetical protein